MLNILVFEIKEGKNAQKVKKILTIIHHYLLEGIAMAEGAMCVGHTTQNIFKI